MEKMICRILLLIILTSCVSGSFVVNVTQTSYQAEENHNITLEWTFTTKPDRSTKTLFIICELFISDKLSVLYHVHEGVEVSESQDEKFSGRVQSDKDALREGRIRLQLSRLRTDDSGLYLCEVNSDYGFGVGRCRLNVTAADEPKHQTPTMNPQTESRGRIYCGFLAAFEKPVEVTSKPANSKRIGLHAALALFAVSELLETRELLQGHNSLPTS
ncbi:uncharacterized protein LOC109195592 isoform X2 [Oreochromis niloticus]|uniref:uncharacterized protein LOC109195592 isoform X2 n=1 Tax=Oreochromis niloticus TaxID=8128 RepID=UPI000DF3CF68|nr:uncharacterized protein LOC109195592 isoform X2 [Oreochromis niloticus]